MTIFFLKRSPVDRRSCDDKREALDLDYFSDGGDERRKGVDRRKSKERRADWVQVDRWRSVYVGKI